MLPHEEWEALITGHHPGCLDWDTWQDSQRPAGYGWCLRDYVHVWDLAAAHVAALTRFDALPGPVTVINLGSGTGTTVRELIAAFNRVADRRIEARSAARRPGDTPAPARASIARSDCWAGGRSTTSRPLQAAARERRRRRPPRARRCCPGWSAADSAAG